MVLLPRRLRPPRSTDARARDATITRWNVGSSEPSLALRRAGDAADNDDRDGPAGGSDALVDAARRVIERRTPESLPVERYEFHRASGVSVRWWSYVVTPLFGSDDQVACVMVRVMDRADAVAPARPGERNGGDGR